MRIGGFLLGSLVGAAAVVYLSRNNTPMMSTWSGASNSINNLVDTARNKMMGMGSKMNQNTQNSNSNTPGMEKVEEMANGNPEVKHQVNEILQDNNSQNEHTMTQ